LLFKGFQKDWWRTVNVCQLLKPANLARKKADTHNPVDLPGELFMPNLQVMVRFAIRGEQEY
jgi:hypothetical protein